MAFFLIFIKATTNCPEGCVHGECVGCNNCSCNFGWEGTNCSTRMFIILYIHLTNITQLFVMVVCMECVLMPIIVRAIQGGLAQIAQ